MSRSLHHGYKKASPPPLATFCAIEQRDGVRHRQPSDRGGCHLPNQPTIRWSPSRRQIRSRTAMAPLSNRISGICPLFLSHPLSYLSLVVWSSAHAPLDWTPWMHVVFEGWPSPLGAIRRARPHCSPPQNLFLGPREGVNLASSACSIPRAQLRYQQPDNGQPSSRSWVTLDECLPKTRNRRAT